MMMRCTICIEPASEGTAAKVSRQVSAMDFDSNLASLWWCTMYCKDK